MQIGCWLGAGVGVGDGDAGLLGPLTTGGVVAGGWVAGGFVGPRSGGCVTPGAPTEVGGGCRPGGVSAIAVWPDPTDGDGVDSPGPTEGGGVSMPASVPARLLATEVTPLLAGGASVNTRSTQAATASPPTAMLRRRTWIRLRRAIRTRWKPP